MNYLPSYHRAMNYIIGTRVATAAGRVLIARALRDLRRTKGRPAAQYERRHMYYVNSGAILTDERLEALAVRRAEKTPGQMAYERDVARTPNYHDGAPRLTWTELCPVARESWERNPTDR